MGQRGRPGAPSVAASIAPFANIPRAKGADLRAAVSARSWGGPSVTTVSAALLPHATGGIDARPSFTYGPRHAGRDVCICPLDLDDAVKLGVLCQAACHVTRLCSKTAEMISRECHFQRLDRGASAELNPSVLRDDQLSRSGDGAAVAAVEALVVLLRQVVT